MITKQFKMDILTIFPNNDNALLANAMLGGGLLKVSDYTKSYLISWDKINDGDWCYDVVNDKVTQYHKGSGQFTNSLIRIIATNDEILSQLPGISNEFINNSDVTRENQYITVLVQHEARTDFKDMEDVINGDAWKLSVDSDNKIIIRPYITNFDRTTMERNLQYCVSLFAAERGLTPTYTEMKAVNEWVNNWIGENL